MNVEKVIAAWRQAGQLSCGTLVDEKGVPCAIGQLFLAAGKSRTEVGAEALLHTGYIRMFDGLLATEYGMSQMDVGWMWTNNDEEVYSSETPQARVVRMVKCVEGRT